MLSYLPIIEKTTERPKALSLVKMSKTIYLIVPFHNVNENLLNTFCTIFSTFDAKELRGGDYIQCTKLTKL